LGKEKERFGRIEGSFLDWTNRKTHAKKRLPDFEAEGLGAKFLRPAISNYFGVGIF